MYGLGGPRELNESLAVIQISKGKWSLCILNKSDNADVFPSSSKTLMGPKRNLEKKILDVFAKPSISGNQKRSIHTH